MAACTPEALDAFAAAVGRRHVRTGRQTLTAAARTTFATTQRLAAIVRPGTLEQVQAVMRAAAEHGITIHPVSGGLNWGYGARVPVADGAALPGPGRSPTSTPEAPGTACPARTAERPAGTRSAAPRIIAETGELWFTDQDRGFYVTRFTNGVWPKASPPQR